MADAPSQPETATTSPDDGPAFIVGMSRAATTWITKCLNEHPDVAAYGETLYWGRHYVPPREDGRYDREQVESIVARLNTADCLHSTLGDGPGCFKALTADAWPAAFERARADLPERPTPGALFLSLNRAVAEAEGKRDAIEKTPHHLNWIGRILAELPGARFVVMVRDAQGFMLSYKHQGDRMEPSVRRQFERRYHPFGCAIVWRGYMRAALAAREAHPDRVHLVAFEDVRRDTERVLDGVQGFLGLDAANLAERVPPDNTSFPREKRPELRADDVFWMNRVAGREIAAAGFPAVTGRRGFGRVLWSFVRLPVWGLYNFFSLRRRVKGSFLKYLWRWLRPGGGS